MPAALEGFVLAPLDHAPSAFSLPVPPHLVRDLCSGAATPAVDRFMLHLSNRGFAPKDAPRLLRWARGLCSDMNAILRDVRVASRHLEYDVSVAGEQMDELVARLEPVGSVSRSRHLIEEEVDRDQAIRDGVSHFNGERFWEAHESLEGVWKDTGGSERILIQGIILVAAALVHHQKNEDYICLSIMGRAQEKLSGHGGTYHGIDIDRLQDTVSSIRKSGRISIFAI